MIDINCDLGEGLNNEAEIMPLIDSCNIACGGHAGDRVSIAECLRLSELYSVKPGAHPSYPDKLNFGRMSMELPEEELIHQLEYQMDLMLEVVVESGIDLHHIKAHGALYNDIARNHKLASVYLRAMEPYKDRLFLYVPWNSAVAEVALENGYKVRYEAFGDRNYNDDLSLVSRHSDQAVLTSKDQVLTHIKEMFENQRVKTVNGLYKTLKADTFCIHSDTENAVDILKYLRESLNT
ncbi:LamB/YcsF family protein [Robertkochia solimangrovi]|uniref:LamB/YcsF family protein n=1 Tax=Robertkochia solimangrovi TaxID=2213046 RepID=UPI001F559E02|nr:LamB/YcsF family protein [Robertkochia solimangrovi]